MTKIQSGLPGPRKREQELLHANGSRFRGWIPNRIICETPHCLQVSIPLTSPEPMYFYSWLHVVHFWLLHEFQMFQYKFPLKVLRVNRCPYQYICELCANLVYDVPVPMQSFQESHLTFGCEWQSNNGKVSQTPMPSSTITFTRFIHALRFLRRWRILTIEDNSVVKCSP